MLHRTRAALAGSCAPFFFRAPPQAVELLVLLGTDCVTLANNHALDYGLDALTDTLNLLATAGIAVVGAGADLEQASRLHRQGQRAGRCGSRSWGSPTTWPTSPPAPIAPGSPSPTSPARCPTGYRRRCGRPTPRSCW